MERSTKISLILLRMPNTPAIASKATKRQQQLVDLPRRS
jgi:hypothetical protein